MAKEKELERLVVKILGDSKVFKKVVDEVKKLLKEVDKLQQSVSGKAAGASRKAASATSKQTQEQRELNKAMREGQKLIFKNATAMERYGMRVQRLDELRAMKVLSRKQYTQAIAGAQKLYDVESGLVAKQIKQTKQKAAANRAFTAASMSLDKQRSNALIANNRREEREARRVQNSIRSASASLDRQRSRTLLADMTRQTSRASQITSQYSTPRQSWARGRMELGDLRSKGMITQGTYDRGIKQLNKELKQATSWTNRWGAAMHKVGTRISEAGRTMSLYVTAPIVAAGAYLTKELLGVDKQITEAIAKYGRAGLGGKSIDTVKGEMQSQVRGFAKSGTTAFSPVQLAKGYEALAGAGLNAAQSMQVLGDVALFAQAGEFDLDTATKTLVNSMSAFGIAADKMSLAQYQQELRKFSDIMVTVASETPASVEQMGRAMSADAAASARQYGMEIETLSAILGVYAMQGKYAEEAGNLFGRAMRLVTDSYVRFQGVWQGEGIETMDPVTGKFKNFIDVLGLLDKKLKSMEAPAAFNLLRRLGLEALARKSVFPLLGYQSELKDLEAKGKVRGSTKQMAEIQMTAMANRLKTFWNQIVVAGMEAADIIAPYILKLAEYVRDLSQWWEASSGTVKKWSLYILGAVAAIGPLMHILGMITSGMGNVTSAAGGMSGALVKVLQTSTALKGVLIGGILVALFLLVKKMTEFAFMTKEANEALIEQARLNKNLATVANVRTSKMLEDIFQAPEGKVREKKVDDYVKQTELEIQGVIKNWREAVADEQGQGILGTRKADIEQYIKLYTELEARLKALKDIQTALKDPRGEALEREADKAGAAGLPTTPLATEGALKDLKGKLEDAIASVGEAGLEAKATKLALDAMGDPKLAPLVDEVNKLVEGLKEAKEAADALEDFNKELVKLDAETAKNQALIAGKDAERALLEYEYGSRTIGGAAPGTKEHKKRMEELLVFYDTNKALEKQVDAQKRLKDLLKDSLTPQERYNEQIKELDELLKILGPSAAGEIQRVKNALAKELREAETDKKKGTRASWDSKGVDVPSIQYNPAELWARIREYYYNKPNVGGPGARPVMPNFAPPARPNIRIPVPGFGGAPFIPPIPGVGPIPTGVQGPQPYTGPMFPGNRLRPYLGRQPISTGVPANMSPGAMPGNRLPSYRGRLAGVAAYRQGAAAAIGAIGVTPRVGGITKPDKIGGMFGPAQGGNGFNITPKGVTEGLSNVPTTRGPTTRGINVAGVGAEAAAAVNAVGRAVGGPAGAGLITQGKLLEQAKAIGPQATPMEKDERIANNTEEIKKDLKALLGLAKSKWGSNELSSANLKG